MMPLLRLLQLASPTLPIGAYAYSQGLESAIEQGWVKDEAGMKSWLLGLLHYSLGHVDFPVFARLYRAWQTDNKAGAAYWNAWLYAARESAELQREDHHLGTALARLLTDLGIEQARPWRTAPRACLATLFSLAAVRWDIPLTEAVTGYGWAWSENQVTAATKLIPLGQTASQRILSQALPEISAIVHRSLALNDDEIGCSVIGLGLASALHETQYSRLFRS